MTAAVFDCTSFSLYRSKQYRKTTLNTLDHCSVLLPISGFNVIYLPYADDFRTLDPPQFPTASQMQVDKMKEIVTKLRFKYR